MSAMFASSSRDEEQKKADQLVAALVGMGLPAKVEPRASLAVVQVTADVMARLSEPEVRRAVIAQAKAMGFTHVAVELSADGGASAAVPRP
jgi:hypothetical protein